MISLKLFLVCTIKSDIQILLFINCKKLKLIKNENEKGTISFTFTLQVYKCSIPK